MTAESDLDLDPSVSARLHELRLRWEDFYWIAFRGGKYVARPRVNPGNEELRAGTGPDLSDQLVEHFAGLPSRNGSH